MLPKEWQFLLQLHFEDIARRKEKRYDYNKFAKKDSEIVFKKLEVLKAYQDEDEELLDCRQSHGA